MALLEEMRGNELDFDEFTCSTVLAACGREGLLEAKEFSNGWSQKDIFQALSRTILCCKCLRRR